MNDEGCFDSRSDVMEGLEDFSCGIFDREPFMLDEIVLG